MHPKNKLAIREALEEGWTCAGWLSLVYYDNGDKLFKGEMVYQDVSRETLSGPKNSRTSRPLHAEQPPSASPPGKRPDVVLTGTSWDQVVETGELRRSDKQQPLPINAKRNSGLVVFKRKRGVSGKTALAAMSRHPGCRIALTVVVILIAALILFLVLKCGA